MKYKQLYDPHSQTIYSIDNKTMIFGALSDELDLKVCLKVHHSNIFIALFSEHPNPISYQYIKTIFKKMDSLVLMIYIHITEFANLDYN